jgi:hypothetical protein
MLVAALGAEVAAYLEAHRDERGDDGHALVVRNGKGRTRKVTVGAGTIAVSAPRVAVSRRSALDCRARRDARPDRAPGPALKPNARGEPPALAAITGQRVPQLDRPVAYSGIAPPANRAPGSRATGVPSRSPQRSRSSLRVGCGMRSVSTRAKRMSAGRPVTSSAGTPPGRGVWPERAEACRCHLAPLIYGDDAIAPV